MRYATPLALCLLISCNQAEDSASAINSEETHSDQSRDVGAPGECIDSADRLEGSGACRVDWQARLEQVRNLDASLPGGCSWELQETPFNDQYLLYLAASCEGTVSMLVHASGTDKDTFYLETSALYDVPVQAHQNWAPVTVISSDLDAPTASLLAFTKTAMQGSGDPDKCIVRQARIDGWPDDALVVDEANPTETAVDGPRSACGTFGYTEESTAYWRVFGGYSWFFELGQDAHSDFDPRTFTLIEPMDEAKP